MDAFTFNILQFFPLKISKMCSVILCFCAPADGGGGSESERDQEIQDEEGAEILRHGAILGWAVDHFESVC